MDNNYMEQNFKSSIDSLSLRVPDLLKRIDEDLQNSRTDIFMFGIVLLEIMFSDVAMLSLPIQPEQNTSSIINQWLNRLPAELASLVDRCCHEDPKRRPTIETVQRDLYKLLDIRSRYNLMTRILRHLELHAHDLENKVMERTRDLLFERRLCDLLLEEMLPRVIVERLRIDGSVDPQIFLCVTVYFSDIDGFGAMALSSSPYDVITFLNHVYSMFDRIIPNFDVYKVETISASYVVTSGVPVPNRGGHAREIAGMSLALMRAYQTAFFRGNTQLRVGLHSGPVAAGVVGQKNLRYCLFGDTMNTASRMQSHGQAGKIHVSSNTGQLLLTESRYRLVSRGMIPIKGKGDLMTFWLEDVRNARALTRRKSSNLQRVLETGYGVPSTD